MEYYTSNEQYGLLEELLLGDLREMDKYNYNTNEEYFKITNEDFDCLASHINTSALHTNSTTCFEDYCWSTHLLPSDQSCLNYVPIGGDVELATDPECFSTAVSSNSQQQIRSIIPTGCFEDYINYSLSVVDDGDTGAASGFQDLDLVGAPVPIPDVRSFNMGYVFTPEITDQRKNKKAKKLSGQPSKNLMAERRRRKRLNDRLLMLRSIVPKISKMDRTSILGDTIDYMKELAERINNLQEEMGVGSNQLGMMSIFKDVKPNEIFVRNSPKFEVERRSSDTKVEICCAGKPALLFSTVTTLEGLGLEIQQCVISCFNDFAMQASCSDQALKRRAVLDTEDIKQALFRNAGYGGKCL